MVPKILGAPQSADEHPRYMSMGPFPTAVYSNGPQYALTKSFIHTDVIHHQEMGIGAAKMKKETEKGIAEEIFMDAPF